MGLFCHPQHVYAIGNLYHRTALAIIIEFREPVRNSLYLHQNRESTFCQVKLFLELLSIAKDSRVGRQLKAFFVIALL